MKLHTSALNTRWIPPCSREMPFPRNSPAPNDDRLDNKNLSCTIIRNPRSGPFSSLHMNSNAFSPDTEKCLRQPMIDCRLSVSLYPNGVRYSSPGQRPGGNMTPLTISFQKTAASNRSSPTSPKKPTSPAAKKPKLPTPHHRKRPPPNRQKTTTRESWNPLAKHRQGNRSG